MSRAWWCCGTAAAIGASYCVVRAWPPSQENKTTTAVRALAIGDVKRLQRLLEEDAKVDWRHVVQAQALKKQAVPAPALKFLLSAAPVAVVTFEPKTWLDMVDSVDASVGTMCLLHPPVLHGFMQSHLLQQEALKGIASSPLFRAVLGEILQADDAASMTRWENLLAKDAVALFSSFGVKEFFMRCIEQRRQCLLATFFQFGMGGSARLRTELEFHLDELLGEAVRVGNANAIAWLVCTFLDAAVEKLAGTNALPLLLFGVDGPSKAPMMRAAKMLLDDIRNAAKTATLHPHLIGPRAQALVMYAHMPRGKLVALEESRTWRPALTNGTSEAIRVALETRGRSWNTAGLAQCVVEEAVVAAICDAAFTSASAGEDEQEHCVDACDLRESLRTLLQTVQEPRRLVQAAFVTASSVGCTVLVHWLWTEYQACVAEVLHDAFVASVVLDVPKDVHVPEWWQQNCAQTTTLLHSYMK